MLVITRNQGVEFKDTFTLINNQTDERIEIKVLNGSSRQISRIGINAPQNITIIRNEILYDENYETRGNK